MSQNDPADWVSIAEYDSGLGAGVSAGLLDGLNIPNRIQHYPKTFNWFIWVPPEFEVDAKEALQQSSVSDADLTAQALSEPPPDDA